MDEQKNIEALNETEKARKFWQCLEYASSVYYDLTNVSSSGNANPKEYWNNAPEYSKKMHICAPSVTIWFNGTEGHAGVVEYIGDDGTIYYTDANYDRNGTIRHITFTDSYYLGKAFPNFKGYVQK